MTNESFCPHCHRAFLCMCMPRDILLPLVTCVFCARVVELDIETELDIENLSAHSNLVKESNPQATPPRRTLCPRKWVYEEEGIFPKGSSNSFVCLKCSPRARAVSYAPDDRELWRPTSARKKKP